MADPNFLSSWSPRRRSRWVLYGFLLVAAFYLLLEHTAHTIPFLPFLVFLACPLMHLFMHGGHGHHHGHHHQQDDRGNSDSDKPGERS